MPAPIIQSIIKPTNFDLFLDEIGFEEVVGEARVAMIDRVREAVEYALVTKIFDRLAPTDKIELVKLMEEGRQTGDDSKANTFLEEKIPNVETLVDEAIEKVKDDFRFSTATIEADIQQQLALLEHDRQASQPREVDEQFNPPSPLSDYRSDEPSTTPIPEPIDPDQEMLRSPLTETRRTLTGPVSSADTLSEEPIPTPVPSIEAPTISDSQSTDVTGSTDEEPPVLDEIPIPPAGVASSTSQQGINEELESLGSAPKL